MIIPAQNCGEYSSIHSLSCSVNMDPFTISWILWILDTEEATEEIIHIIEQHQGKNIQSKITKERYVT
jgi:hypothetical protein